jgi:glycine cleavage system H lipoate-binding protein
MVVCLAPSHPLLLDGVTIDRVEYQIGKLDRASNVVSGKFKRGGQKLTPTSPLCIVHCHGDDNKYIIYSCVKGTLIEINERLLTKPQLLQTHADSQGYVAIVLPNKITDTPTIFDQLLTIEQYQSLRKE